MKIKKKIGYLVIMCVLVCLVAWVLRLFPEQHLPAEVLATLLGVTVTAIVTGALLFSQSEEELKREQNIKTYEEKLRIYKEYLSTICDIVKKGCFSKDEKIQLQFRTSSIAMHTSSARICTISEKIKLLLGDCCGKPGERRSENVNALLKYLFEIVRCFQEELYGSCESNEDNEKILANFYGAFESVTEVDDVVPRLVAKDDGTKSLAKTFSDWHWAWNEGNGKYELRHTGDNPGVVALGVHNGRCYLQAVYLNESDFAKPLKWELEGHRTRGEWWTYLPAPFDALQREQIADAVQNNAGLQPWLQSTCFDLLTALEKFHRTMQWKKALLFRLGNEFRDWNVYIWYWGMLVCQYENDAQGIPYLEIVGEKEGEIRLRLANRNEDNKLFAETLKGLSRELPADHDPKEYIEIDNLPASDIDALANRILEVMEAIQTIKR